MSYILERVRARTAFDPSDRYKLNHRVEHDEATLRKLRSTQPWLFGDSGLLKRTESWHNYEPLQYVRLPRRRNASRGRTAIEDLQDQDDFAEWFTDQFPNLPDGVYGAIKRGGGNRGWCTLFVLQIKHGEVRNWKKKSKTQKQNTVGSSSQYYVLPLFFRLRDQLGV